MTPGFRILDEGAFDGATNMARDEALLGGYAEGGEARLPTVRLYEWSPPALSLGRRQPAIGSHDPSFIASEGIDLVRRPTGGRAVLHEHELTYAVVGALGTASFPGGVLDTYRRISRALESALRTLGVDAIAVSPSREGVRDPGPFGPPACFDRAGAYEIAVRGRKLLGSAQLRRRRAFLQHGSILLRADPRRLARAIGLPAAPERLADLATVLGRPPDTGRLRSAIVAAFEAVLEGPAAPGTLADEESERAAALRAAKYATEAWTIHGRE